MATVRIPAEQRTLTDQAEVTEYLATLGIEYERWPLSQRAAANAPADAVLAASIFHFGEYTVGDVKRYLAQRNIPVRLA